MPIAHKPPLEEWPDYVKTIYIEGCKKIDRLKKQMVDGVCPLPFECWLCEKIKNNFSMLTGDELPICMDCVDTSFLSEEKVGIK